MASKNRRQARSLLVAGGAGFIGSAFVRQCLQQGRRVLVLDALTYAGFRGNLEGLAGPGECDLVTGDIRDQALVSRLLQDWRPDALVNFAAESHVDRSISGPSAFIGTNIQGTFSLLTAARQYYELQNRPENFVFQQISTDEVYGSLGETGKFNEASPYAPNSPYSASKAAADHLVRAWHHTYGLPTLITHCSNNYGPRQFPEKLIPLTISHALEGKPLPVYGTGSNVRDWIHVEDHCRGLLLALDRGVAGETYCFGGGAERRNLDLVRSLCREIDRLQPREDGKPHETGIQFVTDRLGHDQRYAIDDTRAQIELGFSRVYSFETGLRETVKWYLDNRDWCDAVKRRYDQLAASPAAGPEGQE